MTDNGMFSIKDWVEQASQAGYTIPTWLYALLFVSLLLALGGLGAMLAAMFTDADAKFAIAGVISLCVGFILVFCYTALAVTYREVTPDAPSTFEELIVKHTGVSNLRCTSPAQSRSSRWDWGFAPHNVDLDVYDVPKYDLMSCSFATGDGRVFSNGSLRVDSDNWLVGLYGADGSPIAAKEGGDD